MTILTPSDILGNNSPAARRLARYEERPEQLQMAEAVRRAIAESRHLIVEAGTGVGKSFAYLTPAILYAVAHPEESSPLAPSADDSFAPTENIASIERLLSENTRSKEETTKKRVVISTQTISLQEQLFDKDLPFLHSILPYEFTSVLVKGRSNYLCRRRLKSAERRSASLFDDRQYDDLTRLLEWNQKTTDGSLSDLRQQPQPDVWNEVACEHGNCLGKSCPFYAECFYQKARRRIEHASLLIVNHALLFSDLSIRRLGGSILPKYDLLIIDEAHSIEQVAGDHLGLSVSQGQIDFLLNRLYNDRTDKGLLANKKFKKARQAVDQCRMAADDLFDSLDEWLLLHSAGNGRVMEPHIVAPSLAEPLRSLAAQLHEVAASFSEPEQRVEYVAARLKVLAMAGQIDLWIRQTDQECVYWLERAASTRSVRVKMLAAPVHVGPILREHLFSVVPSIILTSASLATGPAHKTDSESSEEEHNRAFSFFMGRIGLTDSETLLLGSPFDYRHQATLVLFENLPNPKEESSSVSPLFLAAVKKAIEQTDGGAFVLFTSYSLLKRTGTALFDWFVKKRYPFFSQGDGVGRSKMVAEFQKNRRSVLFGTDSFWQGVDVPGEALRNVIITRLPFLVPDQPLTEARLEAITLRGDNAFMEYLLPQAILKFKQGFGRLIRSKSDRGQVVILDPRIQTKSYGRKFLQALPDCRVRVERVSE